MCKYPLLFKELLKHMHDDDRDRPLVEAALAAIQSTAAKVDSQVCTRVAPAHAWRAILPGAGVGAEARAGAHGGWQLRPMVRPWPQL